MENFFELLPYIIAVIIFLVRVLGGNKEKTPSDSQPQTIPTTEQTGKSAFDDLLKQVKKQIQEVEKNAQKTAQPKPKNQPKKQSKLDVVNPEHGLTDQQRKKDQHFTPYQVKSVSKSPYAKAFANKNRLKEAFILSEILNRKYF